MAELHVLRVFVDERGRWGNPLGVFLDGASIPPHRRQRIAARLGFSETVFVEDREAGRIRIFTPAVELPFAGHPTVGTAWLLAREGRPVPSLLTPAGEVGVRHEGGTTHVSARPEWVPRFEYRRLESPAAVEALAPLPSEGANTYAWAWEEEGAGRVRARSFVPQEGIAEDEATGSAALGLCARLDRPIAIRQGRGSILRCAPLPGGRAEVGGETRLDEVRDEDL